MCRCSVSLHGGRRERSTIFPSLLNFSQTTCSVDILHQLSAIQLAYIVFENIDCGVIQTTISASLNKGIPCIYHPSAPSWKNTYFLPSRVTMTLSHCLVCTHLNNGFLGGIWIAHRLFSKCIGMYSMDCPMFVAVSRLYSKLSTKPVLSSHTWL